jgi:hypothetical protein
MCTDPDWKREKITDHKVRASCRVRAGREVVDL